ncbi:sialate O-acetylesterase [Paenibacillus sp. HJGM_3]|uniref:sialate O-acetylesterase n=1 Tax=Paenibacillus sp. HJGM_3 TaxID=3379816 RepID=UPI00385B2871
MKPFEGVIAGLTAGAYSLQFRIVAEDSEVILAEDQVEPIFVGDLWLLAGQSNMEGCGTLVNVEEPRTGISCFYLDDRWDVAEDPLCWFNEAVDPVHWTVPVESVHVLLGRNAGLECEEQGLG